LNIKKSHKIDYIQLFNKPHIYYQYNNSFNILSDICPHQGASLSKGWINHKGNLHCPYHGFEFNKDGYFCGIPDPSHSNSIPSKRHLIPSFPTFQFQNDLFMSLNKNNTILPYYPPEHFNDEFISTSGEVIINQDHKIVTENVLDMLHISYIHSFGNKQFPLPFSMKYVELTPTSGRSIFKYKPFEFTISNKIGNTQIVIVENEFHLPTTTITRVIAGDIVKTVLTRSVPISNKKTKMFWTVYRNFWYYKNFDFYNLLGNIIMNYLMKKTLDEDIYILKNIYPDSNHGPLSTKFDITIQKFREKCKLFNLP
jgi:vanillate O-demethylase monooxygenase subunit